MPLLDISNCEDVNNNLGEGFDKLFEATIKVGDPPPGPCVPARVWRGPSPCCSSPASRV